MMEKEGTKPAKRSNSKAPKSKSSSGHTHKSIQLEDDPKATKKSISANTKKRKHYSEEDVELAAPQIKRASGWASEQTLSSLKPKCQSPQSSLVNITSTSPSLLPSSSNQSYKLRQTTQSQSHWASQASSLDRQNLDSSSSDYQTVSQLSLSPLSQNKSEEIIILDDSSDDLKTQHQNDFSFFSPQRPNNTSTFSSSSTQSLVRSKLPPNPMTMQEKPNGNERKLWIDKYLPSKVSDLALHPTKLSTLIESLSGMLRTSQLNTAARMSGSPKVIPGTRILILSGPAGTGKTAAIRLLIGRGLINEELPLENFDCELVEFENPVQHTSLTLDEALTQSGVQPMQAKNSKTSNIEDEGTRFVYESKLKPFLMQILNHKYPSLNITGISTDVQTSANSTTISNITASQQLFPNRLSDSTQSAQQSSTIHSNQKIKVLMVDDMPYLHDLRQKINFQTTVKTLLNSREYNPVVFIMSTSNQGNSTSTNTSPWQVFSKEILEHPSVKLLEFIPVNARNMKKVLVDIANSERIFIPPEELNALIETCGGDLRNAINTLQFFSTHKLPSHLPNLKTNSGKMLNASSSLATSSNSSSKRKNPQNGVSTVDSSDFEVTEIMRKKGSSYSASSTSADQYERVKVFPSLGRDTSLNLFHSIGKILYGKRLKGGEIDDAGMTVKDLAAHPVIPYSSPFYRLPLKPSPEMIHSSSVGFDSSGDTFLVYLQENYPKFFSDVEQLHVASEYLSLAEVFATCNYRESSIVGEYADLLAMRGLLYSNPNPKIEVQAKHSRSAFLPLAKPQCFQSTRLKNDNLEIMDLIFSCPTMTFEHSNQASSQKNSIWNYSIKGQNPISSQSHSTGIYNGSSRTSINTEYDNWVFETGRLGHVKPLTEFETIGRSDLLPNSFTFLNRSQIACELLPFIGIISRGSASATNSRNFSSLNNSLTLYKNLKLPSEMSFIELMCRFSGIQNGSRYTPGLNHTALGEQASTQDNEELETAAMDRDRKRNILENILRERRNPSYSSFQQQSQSGRFATMKQQGASTPGESDDPIEDFL